MKLIPLFIVVAALFALTVRPGLADAPTTGAVGIITGMRAGTYAATGQDLTFLDDPLVPLRVLPILGMGSIQNLKDILSLRGIDAGFVQSDALAYVKQHNLFTPDQIAHISYIAKLYDEEIHVIAGPGINSVADLTGKRINVDVVGSGSAMTADILLNALGIHATVTNLPQAQGVLALEDGKMDAIIHVGGAPIPLLTQIEPGHGLHVIPIQITPELAETYLPDQLTHAEYPDLIPANSPPVPTLAVGDVLAAYDWPPTTQRYKNVAAFVDALFARFSELQKPPHHPKWREVNLAADCPGWPRFPEAQRLIDNMVAEQNLSRFAAEHGVPPLTDQQQQALFRDFVRWEHEQAASNTIDVHTR